MPGMNRLSALATAIFLACASSSGETWVPPWVSEPSAEERARDEYEERQRIEKRLKDIEQEGTQQQPHQPQHPQVEPVSFEAEDQTAIEAERDAVLREMDERYPSPEPHAAPRPEEPPPAAMKAKHRPSRSEPVVRVPEPEERVCCKYCDRGKPCGDTCIARNKTCRVGRGCAC